MTVYELDFSSDFYVYLKLDYISKLSCYSKLTHRYSESDVTKILFEKLKVQNI